MTSKIQKLPTTLVNQIAAGEVIERPASVVKELLENALDAQADHILLELSFGGKNSITVSDNGSGISSEDLYLAISPHATSKIQKLDDLSKVLTMGFRGEALASIASISRFTIQSRPEGQSCATQLQFEDEGVQTTSPCARNVGTTVTVSDLFYNTPVRKRFLGSEKTEFLAIDRLVRCFALSEPEIKLDFYHQGERVFQLPKGNTATLRLARIKKILGKGFVDASIPIKTQHAGLSIEGWIADPQFARSQQDRIWVYVNRRMVNDKLLTHAIKQAYEGKLFPGRYPVCIIYIDINPDEVDVNVHPTKHELRFHQPRLVHDALRSAVSAALPVGQTVEKHVSKDAIFGMHGASGQTQVKPLSTEDISFDWMTLNPKFALLFNPSASFVLDVKRFHADYLRVQLQQISFPLDSRPLFVPVRITIDKPSPLLEEAIGLFAQMGLTLSWFGEGVLLVRTIPVMMPHLNLQMFVLSVLALSKLTKENVLDEMLKHQDLDASLVSDMEKQNWLAYLSSQVACEHSSYLKLLSIENCAVLFHA